MKLAKKISLLSCLRFKVGAVLVRNNIILATAENLRKTHPRFGSGPYYSLHAEGHVIWKAIRKNIEITNSTIYVYRSNGGLAKPCKYCQDILKEFNIKAIYSNGTKEEFSCMDK